MGGYGLALKIKNKKVTHSGSNKPMVGFIGTFHRYCVLGHSANAEDTILAGRSAASPKDPPTVLCREYCD